LLLTCFSLVIHFQCLPCQLNHVWDAIESFDVWDKLFRRFWSNSMLDGCLPNGCLFDCSLDNIIEILDDKKPNVFSNTTC
jgi:hypothetical protein